MHKYCSSVEITRRSISVLIALSVLWLSKSYAIQRLDLELVHFGVNRPTLIKLPEAQWKSTIDSMARHGVRLIRTGLVEPTNRVPDLVAYANGRGIDVLLVIPLWLPHFYMPETRIRPGNQAFHRVYPISAIDTTRFTKFWKEHRVQMRRRGARILGYQVGNEINGAAFNGDYPISRHARLLPLARCDIAEICDQIQRGFRVYVDVLRVIRESGDLDEAALIASGLVKGSADWARRNEGYFSSFTQSISYLISLGASRYVDAYAVHIYPNLRGKDLTLQLNDVARQVSSLIDECSRADSARPACWITEWGVPSKKIGCGTEPMRDAFLRAAFRTIKRQAATGRVAGAIYYDWDFDKRLSIYRCDKPLVDLDIVLPFRQNARLPR